MGKQAQRGTDICLTLTQLESGSYNVNTSPSETNSGLSLFQAPSCGLDPRRWKDQAEMPLVQTWGEIMMEPPESTEFRKSLRLDYIPVSIWSDPLH